MKITIYRSDFRETQEANKRLLSQQDTIGLATKWLRMSSLEAIDKIHNHSDATPNRS